MTSRWISIHTGGPHALDHLGVLAVLLDIPLLVTEEASYLAAKKFYPSLHVNKVEPADLSLEFLSSNFDVIFESTLSWAEELLPLLELFGNKTLRMVYCPHGNSDKKQSGRQDIALFYGPQMKNHLTTTKASRYIQTGNFRLAYYLEHKPLYDELLQNELQGKLDPRKKTVFFAPTWPGQSPSSFEQTARVVREIAPFYNILIRWHPFINELYPAKSSQIRAACPEALFLDDFPCIYPILNLADFYLGDFSSIGYDFLAFNKPLFFLEQQLGDLASCGLYLTANFGQTIRDNEDRLPLQAARETTYRYVFGEKREVKTILEEIHKALLKKRALWIRS